MRTRIKPGTVVVRVRRDNGKRLVFLYLGEDFWINWDGTMKCIPVFREVLEWLAALSGHVRKGSIFVKLHKDGIYDVFLAPNGDVVYAWCTDMEEM